SAAAVIGGAERPHRVRRPVRPVGDLLLAEALEVPVIVERDDAGERSRRTGWLEEQGLGPRAEADRPRQLLPLHAIRREPSSGPDVLGRLVAGGEAKDRADLLAIRD